MLLPLLNIIMNLASAPCDTDVTGAENCRDTLIVNSLAAEIGNGGALTPPLARRVRREALRLVRASPCTSVRNAAVELAFDMSDWLDHEARSTR